MGSVHRMKLAIIDIIGLPYNAETVLKRGLGGSESATIFVAKNLVSIGVDVTVYNNCDVDDEVPGEFDGVSYRPISDLFKDDVPDYDVIVSSRTVIPFCNDTQLEEIDDARTHRFMGKDLYNRVICRAQKRVLWLHDTFCLNDELVEPLTVQGMITDIFTLTDWHNNYIATCNHRGTQRNGDVIKKNLFVTRNGVNIYGDTDIDSKHKNLFVYNASVTKGLKPLVEHIWPKIKQLIPSAKLKVIGGFYRFSKEHGPDQQEQDWVEMTKDAKHKNNDIEFLGVISQTEIAEIYKKAHATIHPGDFPESFGISTLESLAYNTPVICANYGGLEEVGVDDACYKVNYPAVATWAHPWLDVEHEHDCYANAAYDSWMQPLLHHEKQLYCNELKPWIGWDIVALQWKQKFYKDLDKYLPLDEYRKVTRANSKLHKLFDRRWHNECETLQYKAHQQRKFVIISDSTFCKDIYESVSCQDYDNWELIFTNDFPFLHGIKDPRVTYCETRQKADVIRLMGEMDSIIMLIEDRRLVNDPNILHEINNMYVEDDIQCTINSSLNQPFTFEKRVWFDFYANDIDELRIIESSKCETIHQRILY